MIGRFLLGLILTCFPAFSAVVYDNFKDGAYTGVGSAHTTTITASGTNLGCIVYVWYRLSIGPAPSAASCGGNAMTKIQTMSVPCNGGTGTMETWIYFGSGLVAGTLTATVTSAGETILEVITVNGARQSGQPDALAATVSGTSSTGGFNVPMTTVANNSMMIGAACTTTNTTITGNGSFIGKEFAVGMAFWRSTSNVTPAGAFTLNAFGNAPGYSITANGFSIAPPASAVVANPSVSVIAVGP